MTVFCREPRGIKDLVSGAQLFSNKALVFYNQHVYLTEALRTIFK